MRLFLASESPRRRELLAAAGIPFDVDAAPVDETAQAGETPDAYVERLARVKAVTGLARHPGDAVLGADTTVVLGSDMLGKPEDEARAAAILRRLAGRAHDVLTGVALAWQGGVESHVERTRVWMAPMSEAEIAWYARSGEPRDKAGAYAIQGLASRFIMRIEGSYSNVVGLPVAAVLHLLRTAGVDEAIGAWPAGGRPAGLS